MFNNNRTYQSYQSLLSIDIAASHPATIYCHNLQRQGRHFCTEEFCTRAEFSLVKCMKNTLFMWVINSQTGSCTNDILSEICKQISSNVVQDTTNNTYGQTTNENERRKHCTLAVVRRSQKFSAHRRSPSKGRGMAKIGHYLYLQTQFGEDRCMQFWIIVVTDPHTHTTPARFTQTGPITIHCSAIDPGLI